LRSMASSGKCTWQIGRFGGDSFFIKDKAADLLTSCGMGCYSHIPSLEAAGCNNSAVNACDEPCHTLFGAMAAECTTQGMYGDDGRWFNWQDRSAQMLALCINYETANCGQVWQAFSDARCIEDSALMCGSSCTMALDSMASSGKCTDEEYTDAYAKTGMIQEKAANVLNWCGGSSCSQAFSAAQHCIDGPSRCEGDCRASFDFVSGSCSPSDVDPITGDVVLRTIEQQLRFCSPCFSEYFLVQQMDCGFGSRHTAATPAFCAECQGKVDWLMKNCQGEIHPLFDMRYKSWLEDMSFKGAHYCKKNSGGGPKCVKLRPEIADRFGAAPCSGP